MNWYRLSKKKKKKKKDKSEKDAPSGKLDTQLFPKKKKLYQE